MGLGKKGEGKGEGEEKRRRGEMGEKDEMREGDRKE